MQIYGSDATADFPDQMAARNWFMTNQARNDYSKYTKPTVVAAALGEDCGELYIYFFLCSHIALDWCGGTYQ